MSVFLSALALVTSEIAAPGPEGDLAGTMIDAGRDAPVVLIVPGSGPTDRNGNNPLGVSAAPYRLLAEALGKEGVSTVRIDKRGMFGSKAAVSDPNAVTIGDYAHDVHAWSGAIRARTGARCVWVLGHSEGGLIALAAAQQPKGICGLILVSSAGRTFGEVIREQLHSNPANAPVLKAAEGALASLEKGQRVDTAKLPDSLHGLFAAPVQGFLIELLAADPAKLASSTRLPMMIIQGGKDLQVSKADAERLAKARPDAKLVIAPSMNHVLKDVEGAGRAANLAAYADPSLPVDPLVVDSIAGFVRP